jgi:hypothetical protein
MPLLLTRNTGDLNEVGVLIDSLVVAQLFSHALLWNIFLSQKNPIHAL